MLSDRIDSTCCLASASFTVLSTHLCSVSLLGPCAALTLTEHRDQKISMFCLLSVGLNFISLLGDLIIYISSRYKCQAIYRLTHAPCSQQLTENCWGPDSFIHFHCVGPHSLLSFAIVPLASGPGSVEFPMLWTWL